MTEHIKLPPLPEGVKDSWDKRIGEAMQDYARQAIEAALQSQPRTEPKIRMVEATAIDTSCFKSRNGCRIWNNQRSIRHTSLF